MSLFNQRPRLARIKALSAYAGLLLMMAGFQNCGEFSAKDHAKQSFLHSYRVMSQSSLTQDCSILAAIGSEIDCEAPSPTPTPTPTPPGATPTPTPPGMTPTPTPPGMTPTPTPTATPPVCLFCPTPTPTPPMMTPTPTPCPTCMTPTPTPPGMTPTPTPPGMTPTPTPPGPNTIRTDLPAPYLCSTRFTQLNGYNLKTVTEELKLVFIDDNNVKKCEFVDPVIKANLLANKQLTIIDLKGKCPNLQPGQYHLKLVKASQTTKYHRNLLIGLGGVMGVPTGYPGEQLSPDIEAALDHEITEYGVKTNVTARQDGNLDMSFAQAGIGSAMVLYDINTYHGGDGTKCDNSISPLIVQMQREDGLTRKLSLTAQFQGVFFDIMGLRGFPAPHTKKQISWLTRESAADNYYIVMPNARGEVNGIEEMFGDMTSGPDGQFARNGYHALSKWDGRKGDGTFDSKKRDGKITYDDMVFRRLRFWNDANTNGIAEAWEMKTLPELGVTEIDLNYESRYGEVDRFGNKILMKSVVKTADGRLHVMYDLWFKMLD